MGEVIEIVLSAAVICFGGTCHPALVGKTTPRGTFELRLQHRREPMFGGDILVFDEDRTSVWAIHRAHNDRRRQLLASEARTAVTGGCVNVSADVYTQLRECCANAKVVIR